MRGIDHELVEIALAVDGDKAGEGAVLFGDDVNPTSGRPVLKMVWRA